MSTCVSVSVIGPFRTHIEAMATWQWWNYVSCQFSDSREIIRLNMDETSVCLFPGLRKGAIFIDKKRRPPVCKTPSSKRRCCMTYITFVCDRPDVQPLLPQIVVANEHTFPAKSFQRLKAAAPPYIRLIRQKSAWNNSLLCAKVIRVLREVLNSIVPNCQAVLLMDAHRLHVSKQVLDACGTARICIILVPALMTWLLQPLDAECFHAFKIELQEQYQVARALSGGDELSIDQFLACLYASIDTTVQRRPWTHVFDRLGFGSCQKALGHTVKSELQLHDVIHVPHDRPSLALLQLCFPRNSKIPVASIWRTIDHAGNQCAAGSVAVAAGVLQSDSLRAGTTCADVVADVSARASNNIDATGLAPPRARRVLPSSFHARAHRHRLRSEPQR